MTLFACRSLMTVRESVSFPTSRCTGGASAGGESQSECVALGEGAAWTAYTTGQFPALCGANGGTWDPDRSALCERFSEQCGSWVNVGLTTSDQLYPSGTDGAALYAWGFAAVIAPAIILWSAVVIVRGIRMFLTPESRKGDE